jgi:hypothetical protein
MRDGDPLEGWLDLVYMLKTIPPQSRGARREARDGLNALARAVAQAAGGKVDLDRVRGSVLGRYSGATLSDADVAEAQRLFLALWEQGGSGLSYVLESLLDGLALAMSPASVPFWQQLLDLSRPRDRTTTPRRTYALAALALLAIERDEPRAYEALATALEHPHEQVRGLAAYYLAEAYRIPERSVPEPVAAALTVRAANDRAFAPRFQARMALAVLGLPPVLDPLDRAYLFEVKLRGNSATRVIAAAPQNTLADLHYAIQRAFEWDADHLYSFSMNGKRDDGLYEIECPGMGDDWDFEALQLLTLGPDGTLVPIEGADADEEDADDGIELEDEEDDDQGDAAGGLDTTTVPLCALGLTPRHTFLYYFDFGDSHQFDVKMLGTTARDAGDYPRLVEAKGEAPRQYHGWEDEDDEYDESPVAPDEGSEA